MLLGAWFLGWQPLPCSLLLKHLEDNCSGAGPAVQALLARHEVTQGSSPCCFIPCSSSSGLAGDCLNHHIDPKPLNSGDTGKAKEQDFLASVLLAGNTHESHLLCSTALLDMETFIRGALQGTGHLPVQTPNLLHLATRGLCNRV